MSSIGACTGDVTRHSTSSVLPCSSARGSDRDRKGGRDVRTADEERPGAALEVVLGVDTHLDAHVGVALETTLAGAYQVH